MRWLSATAIVALLSGCVGGVDLSTDAFAGRWDCNGVPVTMTGAMVTVDGEARSIAYVERGGNADYGFTATDGTRFSVFDTTRRSLTFVTHEDSATFACTRLS